MSRLCLLLAVYHFTGAGGQTDIGGHGRLHVNGAAAFYESGRYAAFIFPPPGMCFPDNAAVYVATAITDGLFLDPRVRGEGIRLRLRINGFDMATINWDGSSGLEEDEGLAHHFSIPGLPDGEHDAELAILLGGRDDALVGLSAETTFEVDHTGKCSLDPADHLDVPLQNLHTPRPSCEQGTEEECCNGNSTDWLGIESQVLVNVALGKRSWMSSVSAESDAHYACDGLTMVTSLVERNAITALPLARTSSSHAPNSKGASDGADRVHELKKARRHCEDAWWEVDLGLVHQVHLVDVWAGKKAGARGAYPPVVPLQPRYPPQTLARVWCLRCDLSTSPQIH